MLRLCYKAAIDAIEAADGGLLFPEDVPMIPELVGNPVNCLLEAKRSLSKDFLYRIPCKYLINKA